ncbi:DUF2971 domain-containing protein [Halorubrum aethiopicum]|uniref:DUF2971 domain-containing protein n=1 Tax=Halorubrum aethiopicum TaxID=1758255 RepID=UPI000B18F8BF|nr:DUF2971 domain-containing protein [Halorubrum aethiopicum]
MPYIERLSDPRHPEVEEYENAFDLPELEDDEFLWRYLSVEQYLSLLLESSLYFSRADRLEDKFEGTLPEATHLDPDIRQIYREYRTLVHLNCWHVNQVESVLMWDSYAPRGVVIKTTLDELLDSLDVEDDFSIHIGEAEYVDFSQSSLNLIDRSEESRSGSVLDLFKYKREYYSGEREVRLITNVLAAYSQRDDLEGRSESVEALGQHEEDKIRIDVDLNHLLKEVIVHPGADRNTLKAFRAVTDRMCDLGDRLRRSDIEGEPSL